MGYLATSDAATATSESFRQNMRELGWIDGRNLRIEYRWGAGKAENLTAFAAELARMRVDVIVGQATPVVAAVKAATTSIPIVMGPAADAEGSGFVASLSRPGGNITGVSLMQPALAGKRLELLKEIVPRMTRVAYLAYAPDPAHKLFLKQTQEAGSLLKVRIQPVLVNRPDDLPGAFTAMTRERADALIVQPIFSSALGLGPRVAELAAQHRLASISDGNAYADGGGLIYYVEGKNFIIEYRSADGKTETFPKLASELVNLKVDAILSAGGSPSHFAAKQATRSVPIII